MEISRERQGCPSQTHLGVNGLWITPKQRRKSPSRWTNNLTDACVTDSCPSPPGTTAAPISVVVKVSGFFEHPAFARFFCAENNGQNNKTSFGVRPKRSDCS